jgi:endogenous inhibitor of DNA gyrase (YacG/DUF329 family)
MARYTSSSSAEVRYCEQCGKPIPKRRKATRFCSLKCMRTEAVISWSGEVSETEMVPYPYDNRVVELLLAVGRQAVRDERNGMTDAIEWLARIRRESTRYATSTDHN